MISIQKTKKLFGETVIMNNFDFSVKKGEFVAVIGPNGCGKSTLLNIISGFIKQDAGSVEVEANNISYVGQNPDEMLLPWLTIEENIAFPKKVSDVESKRIDFLLDTFKLKNYRKNYPSCLSGGMKQVLLVIRALVNNSEVLLLDEPFKSLDFDISIKIQEKLRQLWFRNKPTIVLVSHNIEEAVFLSQKVFVLSDKPVSIKKIVDTDIENKDINFLMSKDFLRLKSEILKTFYER